MEKWITFVTYKNFVLNLCLDQLMSTYLSSLQSWGVEKQGKSDILSVQATSIIIGHNANRGMEEEYKDEELILDRGRTDLFVLLKSKLLRLENKKRNEDNDKLPLLLTFPYIHTTTELESMIVRNIGPIDFIVLVYSNSVLYVHC